MRVPLENNWAPFFYIFYSFTLIKNHQIFVFREKCSTKAHVIKSNCMDNIFQNFGSISRTLEEFSPHQRKLNDFNILFPMYHTNNTPCKHKFFIFI